MKKACQKKLLAWFEENKRPLPWRKNKDPYRIWISEVMLQQTTSQAVIPYFENFIKKFPKLKDLAMAPQEDVLQAWAGLGYYSRARNLHKAAKELYKIKNFPKSHEELIKLPGFGPYTSRAVSSIAFAEPAGVVDGNVIRVLCRFHGKKSKWWQTAGRKELQTLADDCVADVDSGNMNQALMELGASICLPQNPRCLLCPISKDCKAFKNPSLKKLPLKKPKKEMQIWLWKPVLKKRKDEILLAKNEAGPFLKKQWLLPGEYKRLDKRPANFDYKHTITHHEIYVQMQKNKVNMKDLKEHRWVKEKDIKKLAPFSLLEKALKL